jgi:hypothetical protein
MIWCTFPGRAGDLLWALPTVRAISQALGEPVSLQIAGEFASMIPLLETQPYLVQVYADPRWSLTPPDEWKAPPIGNYSDQIVFHLGYRGWPTTTLPHFVYNSVQENNPHLNLPPLDLQTPWIVPPTPPLKGFKPPPLIAWFSDEWVELKAGVVLSLSPYMAILCPHGSRWMEWEQDNYDIIECDWLEAAQWVKDAKVVLACCSAPHVLAVAMGKPVVMLEPSQARHNEIFYPLGKTGPQVTLVTGSDGLPTFDSRAIRKALEEKLK